MAPIIQTEDARAVQLLDLAGVKYTLVQTEKTQTSAQTPKPIEKANYILLEGREHGNYSYPDMLVPFAKTHLNERWFDCTTPKLLESENGYMLTGRQEVDFLRLVKSGKAFDGNGKRIESGKLHDLFNDITEVRSPWRAEWIDAKFGDKTITYHKINKDGSIREVTESLGDALMQDKTPGISLDSWLKTADKHGMPTSKTKEGSLCYWYLRENAVAWFNADSSRAYFNCGGDPANRDDSLGARVARLRGN